MSESNIAPAVPVHSTTTVPTHKPQPTPAPALTGTYPERFAELEQQMIDERRRAWGAPPSPPVIAGLALSGGGIRSATFCLGLLQALARRSLLQRFDFLSTVSGGGYIGSFLGAWINREGAATVQRDLPDCDSKPVRFLRNNGRYLAPNGSGDLMTATAAQLRNWFAVWLVLGTLVLGAFILAEAVKIGTRNWDWSQSMRRIAERAEQRSVTTPMAVPAPPNATVETGATTRVQAVLQAADSVVAQAAAPPRSFWKTAGEHISLSPFFYVAAWVLLFFGLSTATAYWFVGSVMKLWPLWILLALIGAALAWYLLGAATDWTLRRRMLAAGCYIVTVALAIRAALSAHEPDIGRNWITDRLAAALMLAISVAVFAVIDTVGQSLALDARWWLSAALLPALAVVARWVMPTLTEASKTGLPTWVGKLILPLVAVVIALLALGVLGMAAHRIGGLVLFGTTFPPNFIPSSDPSEILLNALMVAGVALGVLIVAAALGLKFVFVNASSQHRLYSARLTRAYLGASNPWRIDPAKMRAAARAARQESLITDNARAGDVTTSLQGDQIEYLNYTPHRRGGPLHLINATVNETISGISQLEQRDRRGFSFAIGPAGLSVRNSDHAEFLRVEPPKPEPGCAYIQGGKPGGFHTLAVKTGKPIQIELPPLGSWVGISGAAFTTGLGSRTNVAFSFLLGFFNVRLGYWWNSGVLPQMRAGVAPRPAGVRIADVLSRCFSAQSGLLDEFLARFHGPARQHWYLSDGGHFENSGLYELIRRRIPLMVCCDCGADPEYKFEDLASLVRKARIDFRAEIQFWDESQINAQFGPQAAIPLPRLCAAVGPLSQLGLQTTGPAEGFARKHAVLATVTYREGGQSLLLVIKPTVTAETPLDVCQYDSTDSAFPQQSTIDQFFDEAQWESYRKLGDYIGGRLFGDTDGAGSAEWDALASLALTFAQSRTPGQPPAPAMAGIRLQSVA